MINKLYSYAEYFYFYFIYFTNTVRVNFDAQNSLNKICRA